MDRVTIATFHEPEKAEPLRQRLELAGIAAEIHDERALQRYYFLSPPLAGIRLRVARSEYPKAEKLLQQWEGTDGALRDAIRCPECGSSRVEFPQFSRRFAWGGIAALCASLGFFERKFFCKQCQYTWPTRTHVEPDGDVLGWPRNDKRYRIASQDHPNVPAKDK